MAVWAREEETVADLGGGGTVLKSSLVTLPEAPYVPAEEAAAAASVSYPENVAVPASPNVQLSSDPTPASERIPSQNVTFRNAYSPCGDGGNMGDVFADAKETNNNPSTDFDLGHDDKYATLHWNEDTEEYFWGAEGTNNCYIGKHLGNGVGGDLTKGSCNVGVGVDSGFKMTEADYNVWIGMESLYYSTVPQYCVAVGYQSGYYMDDGRGNTFVGAKSGFNTSDVVRESHTYETPTWARIFLSTVSSPSLSNPLADLDGLLVRFERTDSANTIDVNTSSDGITWTLEDTATIASGGYTSYWLSNSVTFLGRSWSNAYGPNGNGEGFLAVWDGVNLNPSMLYEDYYPLSPNNAYVSRLFVFQGCLFAITDVTAFVGSSGYRTVYWTADGATWTVVPYYVDLATTYYDWGTASGPDLIHNFPSKTNRLIEFDDDLYWVTSRYESSLWKTKILKMNPGRTLFSVVGSISPAFNYLHPFAAEVVGDTCFVLLQELGSGGSPGAADECRVLLYTSTDMINWTLRKDYGDIGIVSDCIWFERELVLVRYDVTTGVHYVDRINTLTYEITNETTINTNTTTTAGADLHVYKGVLYLGKYAEVHKRTRTTWFTDEIAYDVVASYNTFIGLGAGNTNVTGNGNTILGALADVGNGELINATAIGYRAICSASNSIVLGGTEDFAVRVGIGRTAPGFTLDVAGDARFTEPVTITKAAGTAPLIITSTTVVANLNADLWDGIHLTSLLGLNNLTDPGGDRILFWDDSETALKWLSCGVSLSISATTLNTIQDIRTSAGPSFNHLHLTIATGTAPMVVSSTTVVSNLNADLLDGLHYTSFIPRVIQATATPGIDDDVDTYLEGTIWIEQDANKAYILVDNANGAAVWTEIAGSASIAFADLTDYPADAAGVLTNDGAGNLSWAAAGGSLAFADLTDYPADAAGVLTNDGAGNLSWGAGGGSLAFADLTDYPADAAGFLENDGAGALSWDTLAQADVAGLTTADSPNFAGLSVGTNDVARGLLYLYGHDTGGVFGGTLVCHTSADHDAVISNYGFMVKEDDLMIGPDTNVDALLLDSNDDLYITGGSLVLPASEYLNFGGTLGSGGYGLRDNAGEIEYKDSGGAWVALNAGGGSLAFADLTDYPADAAGVLTNDGAGALSWGAGGGSVAFADLTDYPADTAGVLTNDGSGNLSWEPGGTNTFWSPDIFPSSPTSQSDHFEDASINAKWTAFQAAATLTVTEAGHHLKMVNTGDGGDAFRGYFQALPSGDFTITIKVDLIVPLENYISAGICLFEDATNNPNTCDLLIYSVRAASGVMTTNITRMSQWNSWNSELSDLGHTPDQPPYLRIRRSGTTLYYEHSFDGVYWILQYSAAQPFTPAEMGITFWNYTGATTATAMFDWFYYHGANVTVSPVGAGGGGGAAHAMLSVTHDDTTASTVSRGSIIIGNSTPKWAELAVGSAGQVLTTDGTDISWGSTVKLDVLELGEQSSDPSAEAGMGKVYVGLEDAYTVLLLHGNGSDDGTTITDETGKTVTRSGNVCTKTGVKKFGTASIYFDGNGDYLTIPDSSAWDFGFGDFTIDLWIYITSMPAGNSWPNFAGIFHQGNDSSADQNALYIGSTDIFFGASDYAVIVTATHNFSINTWYHIAVVRCGSDWNIYKDGTSIAYGYYSAALPTYARDLTIGCEEYGAQGYFTGYMDEYRVTKGFARWKGNFTPPTSEYDYPEKALVYMNAKGYKTILAA